MSDSPPVAAIDCGTNSTRLIVGALGDDGRLVTLAREMRITRLGKGVDATGRLAPEAIERTLAVLRDYREVMDRFGVGRPSAGERIDGPSAGERVKGVRATATSAARDASNRDDFFGPAEAILGAPLELLSGEQEAALSFAGAVSDLDPALGPFAVVDIGGGSTEFAYGTTTVEGSLSVDMGCVRMTEQFLHHDPPLPEELSNCLSIVELYLDDVRRAVPGIDDAKTLVGLAGTVTTVAAVEIGLLTYDRDRTHHFVLTKEAAEDVFRTLATEPLELRKDNPGLDPRRADVIVGGTCVLVELMRHFGFGSCLVSEADILDGLALSLLGYSRPDAAA